MKLQPVLQVFGDGDEVTVREYVSKVCTSLVRRSTWGQFARDGLGFTERDAIQIGGTIAAYIVLPVDEIADLRCELSGPCYMVGRVFDPHEFARKESADLLTENLFPRSTDSSCFIDVDHEATAAIIYRYRYCFLEDEFFDIRGIALWVRMLSGRYDNSILLRRLVALLQALEAISGDVPADGQSFALRLLDETCRRFSPLQQLQSYESGGEVLPAEL